MRSKFQILLHGMYYIKTIILCKYIIFCWDSAEVIFSDVSMMKQSDGSNKQTVQNKFGSEMNKKYSLKDFSTIHVDLQQ
jgi:hypothetical protein